MTEEIKLILDNKDLGNDQKTQILIELFKSKQFTGWWGVAPYIIPQSPTIVPYHHTEITCSHEPK